MVRSLSIVMVVAVCLWLIGCMSSSACPGRVGRQRDGRLHPGRGQWISMRPTGLWIARLSDRPPTQTAMLSKPNCRRMTDSPIARALKIATLAKPAIWSYSNGGKCALTCEKKTDCLQFGDNFYCDQEQSCRMGDEPTSCLETGDCSYGMICHTKPGLCEIPCFDEESTWCRDRFGAEYYCSGQGTCRKRNAADDLCTGFGLRKSESLPRSIRRRHLQGIMPGYQ